MASRFAELLIRDAEKLRKGLCRLRRQVFVRAQVSFDDVGRRFVRVIDHRLDVVAQMFCHQAIDRHIQPLRQPGNIVGIGTARAVLDTRKRRGRNLGHIRNVTQT